MGSNLVLLNILDCVYSVYILARNFELISDCTKKDFFIEFWCGKETFKIYLIENYPDSSLLLAMQCFDIDTRDNLLNKFSDHVTNDIINFILKGDNTDKPFPVHDYIDDWLKFANSIVEDYFTHNQI